MYMMSLPEKKKTKKNNAVNDQELFANDADHSSSCETLRSAA